MANLTTAENMALAVLQGDFQAARALADYLMEHYAPGGLELLPRREVVDLKKCRVVVYPKSNRFISVDESRQIGVAVRDWVTGKCPTLAAVAVDRIEVFEFPEGNPSWEGSGPVEPAVVISPNSEFPQAPMYASSEVVEQALGEWEADEDDDEGFAE